MKQNSFAWRYGSKKMRFNFDTAYTSHRCRMEPLLQYIWIRSGHSGGGNHGRNDIFYCQIPREKRTTAISSREAPAFKPSPRCSDFCVHFNHNPSYFKYTFIHHRPKCAIPAFGIPKFYSRSYCSSMGI